MHAMTEADVREAFVNAPDDELELVALPVDFPLVDWDHLDFFAWRDPRMKGRGYVIAEIDGRHVGVVLRASNPSSRGRASMCNLCHTMQPGDQVSMFTARRAGRPGIDGDTIGTYICSDLSCHENVRLAPPLAPSEMRASVDRKIDGTRARMEAFVSRVLETVDA